MQRQLWQASAIVALLGAALWLWVASSPPSPPPQPRPTAVDHNLPGGLDRAGLLGVKIDLASSRAQIIRHAQQPRKVLNSFDSVAAGLDLSGIPTRPTDILLDVGAGTGALELRLLLDRVPFATLHAVDVNSEALDLQTLMLRTLPLDRPERVQQHLTVDGSMHLPDASIDVAFVVTSPIACTRRDADMAQARDLAGVLRPGAVLHYYAEHDAQFCRRDDVLANFERAGLRTENTRIEFVRRPEPLPDTPGSIAEPPSSPKPIEHWTLRKPAPQPSIDAGPAPR
jgi:SAM-dependent methyltransferase